MRRRVGFPAGVPCWVDTAQPDPAAAAEFYGGLFGWEFADRTAPEAPGRYHVASLGGRDVAGIGSPADSSPLAYSSPLAESSALTGSARWHTSIGVDSADEAVARVRRAGGRVIAEPVDVLDAGRTATCVDPAGASFALWEAPGTPGRRTRQRAGDLELERPAHP